jgi:hypothetical protein
MVRNVTENRLVREDVGGTMRSTRRLRCSRAPVGAGQRVFVTSRCSFEMVAKAAILAPEPWCPWAPLSLALDGLGASAFT